METQIIMTLINLSAASIKEIAAVIKKLPHSKGRVPYTYHHDYCRMKIAWLMGQSRSQVSVNHDHDESTMYSLCLAMICEDIGMESLFSFIDQGEITMEDFDIIRFALRIGAASQLPF